jgi:biopolymer transport protein TolQ
MTVITLDTVLPLTTAVSATTGFGSDIIKMVLHAGLVVKLILLILILFSIVSWAIILAKYRLFRRAKQETAYFLDLFWETKELKSIYKECADLLFSPVANLFRAGYSELVRMKKIQGTPGPQNGDTSMDGLADYVERSLKRTSLSQGSRMEKALSFLATTGNTAPFIGLFGTVWGIMESFQVIGQKGSASLAVVAPGISEALIATAAGLFAAIPAVIAFNYFSNQVSEMKSEMDTFAADFMAMVERQIFKKSRMTKDFSETHSPIGGH